MCIRDRVEGVHGDVVAVRIGAIRNHEGFDSPLTNELPVKLVWLPARRSDEAKAEADTPNPNPDADESGRDPDE